MKEKNFFEELEKYNNSTSKETYNNNLNGTEKNINYFLKLANIVKKILFVFAGIIIIIGLMATSGTDEVEILILCFIGGISLVIIAILSTPFLEWKAYMLKTIYEINKSIKGKK